MAGFNVPGPAYDENVSEFNRTGAECGTKPHERDVIGVLNGFGVSGVSVCNNNINVGSCNVSNNDIE